MAALTADKIRASAYPGQGYIADLFSDVNDTYFKGAVVSFKANGAIKVASGVSTEHVAGVVMENTVVTGGFGFVPVLCRSRVWFDAPGVSATNVGDFLRALDDNDIANAVAGRSDNIGLAVGFQPGTVAGTVQGERVLLDMAWTA